MKIQIIEIPRFFVYKNGCRGGRGKFRFGGIKKSGDFSALRFITYNNILG